MKNRDVKKIADLLREQAVTHLLLVGSEDGISLSSLATGDDIYDFLQVMIDVNPDILDIMRSVVASRAFDEDNEEYAN